MASGAKIASRAKQVGVACSWQKLFEGFASSRARSNAVGANKLERVSSKAFAACKHDQNLSLLNAGRPVLPGLGWQSSAAWRPQMRWHSAIWSADLCRGDSPWGDDIILLYSSQQSLHNASAQDVSSISWASEGLLCQKSASVSTRPATASSGPSLLSSSCPSLLAPAALVSTALAKRHLHPMRPCKAASDAIHSRHGLPTELEGSYPARRGTLAVSSGQSRNFHSSKLCWTLQRDVTRDAKFARIEQSDLDFFRSVLDDRDVVTDGDVLQVANRDWMGKYEGRSELLLRPRTTQQVSSILSHCNRRQLAVVPQGGNTGLVGGSVPVFDEIIVSLAAMNRVVDFDEVSGVLVCEAGCILESLDAFLAARGFMMPLDLGAKGSCQIGGNVSTNAGGIRLLRYGSLHGSVLGIEAVLADGSVLDLLRVLRKDNTGYDLKQLFIGAEGTLGLVTKVALLTPHRCSSVHVAFLACPSYAKLQATLMEAKKHLGETLSAFEFVDQQSLALVVRHLGCRNPLPTSSSPFFALVETAGSNEQHDRQKLDSFLEAVMEGGEVEDGTVAQDESQAAAIWRVREGVAEALQKAGAVFKYDLSLPSAQLYSLVEEMRQRLDGVADVVGYGHLGDGNLHLNVSAAEYSPEILGMIEPFVYEWTAARGGSISAEHGLGLMKATAISYSKPKQAVDLMLKLKKLFDPVGILNPYKVLPPS